MPSLADPGSNRLHPFLPKLVTVFLEGYNLKDFRKDLIAGIIVGILSIPLSIAFAIASGARPEQGLVTAVVAGFLGAVSSGSRFQISGPTGAFVILVFDTITRYGYDGLIIATLLAGLLLIIAGFSKIGAIIKFIPYSVTVGFTSGIALLIATAQVPDLLAIHLPDGSTHFVQKWHAILTHLPDTNLISLLIGLASILIITMWPKLKTPLPGSLAAIIATTAVVQLFGIPCETIGDRFGNLAFCAPCLVLPDVSFEKVMRLIEPAFAIAALAGIESLLSAVVADGMTGRRHRSHMELISQGLANIGSALTGGLPATGAIVRTATNIRSGAVSPVAGAIHSLFILVATLFLGTTISTIPMATLAGLLLVIAYNMFEGHKFISLAKAPIGDMAILLLTFFLTVFVDLVFAIEVGIILGAFISLNRIAEASGMKNLKETINQEESSKDVEFLHSLNLPKEIEVFEIYGSLFFAAMEKFMLAESRMKRMPKVFILHMTHVLFIDASGIQLLTELLEQSKRSKTVLLIAGISKQSPVYRTLDKAHFVKKIGKEHIFYRLQDAAAYAKSHCLIQ